MAMRYANNKKSSFAPAVKRRKSFIARKRVIAPYGRELHVSGVK